MFYPRPPMQQAQVLPPRIHPTKQNVVYNCCEYVVPEVHPSHTTLVNKHLYKHYHSFPHTQSVVNEVANQQYVCPPGPGAYGAGMAPGVAPGTAYGAGMAPGMAPAPRRRFF